MTTITPEATAAAKVSRRSSRLAPAPGEEGVAPFRRYLVGLSTLSCLATAIELASERHWGRTVRLIPWVSIGVLLIGIVLFVSHPSSRVLKVVRGLAIAVSLSGLVGIYEHVAGNQNAGYLDFRYAERWPTMSFWARWWTALSKTVGPAPTLAPAALIFAATLLFVATLHHPALAARRRAKKSKSKSTIDLSTL